LGGNPGPPSSSRRVLFVSEVKLPVVKHRSQTFVNLQKLNIEQTLPRYFDLTKTYDA
jgi:hypothetical protein